MASFRRGLLEREHGQLAHKERQGFAVCRCEQLQLNDIDAPLTRLAPLKINDCGTPIFTAA